jgi:hypothetical protein
MRGTTTPRRSSPAKDAQLASKTMVEGPYVRVLANDGAGRGKAAERISPRATKTLPDGWRGARE